MKIGRYDICSAGGEIEIMDTYDNNTWYVYLNEEELLGCLKLFYGMSLEDMVERGEFDEQVMARARDLDWRHVDDRG